MKLPESLLSSSWQWAKLGGALYGLGLVITSLYFLRFSILSLDLLRPQSVLVGAYFAALYFLLPALFLLLLKRSPSLRFTSAGFAGLLLAKELGVYLLLSSLDVAAISLILVSVVLQLVLFARFPSPLRGSDIRLQFGVLPQGWPAALTTTGLLAVFAFSVYGSIPGYLGGGRPTSVHVFTKTPELPANRFLRTRNMPQVNKAITSFKLDLLYEADDYIYFVADHRSSEMSGYDVMRLRREEVIRMDYVTPTWINLRGQR